MAKKPTLTVEQVNDLLNQTRDQKFRLISEKKLEANYQQAFRMREFYATPPGDVRKQIHSHRRSHLNHHRYGQGTYVVRSPGNDLLDFYDQQNLMMKGRCQSAIPPSLIFKIRFRTEFPEIINGNNQHKPTRIGMIRDMCADYKQTNDNSYWHQLLKIRMDWLVDQPHHTHEFKYMEDCLKFLADQFNQSGFRRKLSVNGQGVKEMMFWRGVARGWSIVYHTQKEGAPND